MNYSQAKARAKELTNIRRIDHVIAFDGKSYSVHMRPKHKGDVTEIVKYKYVKPKADVPKISKPVKYSGQDRGENL